jgi:tetratricopeptide (TPR) repeat protein
LEYIGTLFLVSVVTCFCIYISKRQRLWLTVWGYYIITLVPVLGLIQVGGQFMADRYTYLPSLGPFFIIGLFIAWSLHKLIVLKNNKNISIILVSVFCTLIVVSMSYLTYMQIGIWKNGIDLWSYVIKKEPEKVLFAYYNRGGALAKAGKYHEAIEDYSRVINKNYKEYSKVYVDRGLVYLKIGKTEPAIDDFRKACDLRDGFGCKALRIYSRNGSR